MKYSSIVGLVLTVIGLFLFIIQEPDYTYKEFYIAVFLAGGIGLIIGGILGYLQKKRKIVIKEVETPRVTTENQEKSIKEQN